MNADNLVSGYSPENLTKMRAELKLRNRVAARLSGVVRVGAFIIRCREGAKRNDYHGQEDACHFAWQERSRANPRAALYATPDFSRRVKYSSG